MLSVRIVSPFRWQNVLLGMLGVATLVPGVPIYVGYLLGFPAWSVVTSALAVAAWIYLLAHASGMRLDADERGLTIVSFWATERVAWSDVAEIGASFQVDRGKAGVQLYVQTKTGKRIDAVGTQLPVTTAAALADKLAPLVAVAKRHEVACTWAGDGPEIGR